MDFPKKELMVKRI
ncbi:hypothetical protein F383_29985 [Gossypium arboreum]|uniref:Uncharacterized protein n=1 Tax=Gossypium arboreum TaxID=29729 RepID=A0A0B0PKR1_GOSAR|nr:hypothetical protein F383_29985 [Gossypium arboreum]